MISILFYILHWLGCVFIKAYKIHFIRHGITQGNLDGKYVGITDYPLCRDGIEELEELRHEYEYPKAQKVYTSPLLRCVQTADILFPDILTEPVDDMKEYNFGAFEDKTMLELQNNPDFQKWLASGMVDTPVGGEDKQEFYLRLKRGFDKILADMMQLKIYDAAVITHGGVIMGLLAMFGYPKRKPLDWRVGNGKGYTALITPQIWAGGQVFEVFDPLPYGCADIASLTGYNIVEIDNRE